MTNHTDIVETGFYAAHEAAVLAWMADTITGETEHDAANAALETLTDRVAAETEEFETEGMPDWEDRIEATRADVAALIAAWPVPITRARVTIPWPGGHTLPATRYSVA